MKTGFKKPWSQRPFLLSSFDDLTSLCENVGLTFDVGLGFVLHFYTRSAQNAYLASLY